jgi:hypothetical protein
MKMRTSTTTPAAITIESVRPPLHPFGRLGPDLVFSVPGGHPHGLAIA